MLRVHCAVLNARTSTLVCTCSQSYGGHGERETPGNIPNPEAKPLSADGTALETGWESRTPPDNHSRTGPSIRAGARSSFHAPRTPDTHRPSVQKADRPRPAFCTESCRRPKTGDVRRPPPSGLVRARPAPSHRQALLLPCVRACSQELVRMTSRWVARVIAT